MSSAVRSTWLQESSYWAEWCSHSVRAGVCMPRSSSSDKILLPDKIGERRSQATAAGKRRVALLNEVVATLLWTLHLRL